MFLAYLSANHEEKTFSHIHCYWLKNVIPDFCMKKTKIAPKNDFDSLVTFIQTYSGTLVENVQKESHSLNDVIHSGGLFAPNRLYIGFHITY